MHSAADRLSPSTVTLVWFRSAMFVLGTLSLLALSACNRAPSTPPSTLDWPSVDPALLMDRSGLSSPFQLQGALSPDGRWLTRDLVAEGEAIRVFSPSDPDLVLEVSVDVALGRHLLLGPWAPDSASFVLYAAEEGRSHCPFSRVLLVHLDESQGKLTYDAFDPQCTAPSPFSSASWSPDGAMVAVTLNQKQFYLLDRQANLKHTVSPELGAEGRLVDLWWTHSGLIYRVSSVGPEGQHEALRLVDPDSPDQHRTLFQSQRALAVVGSNSLSGQVLIREQDSGYPPAETFDLLVVDPGDGTVEHKVTMEGTQCVVDSTPQPRFTALKVSSPDGPCVLWFYDWEENELRRQGELVALVGWRANAQGFLLVAGAAPDDLRFEVVRPE